MSHYFNGSDDWITLLNSEQQRKVCNYLNRYKEENSDPPLLEFAGFKDKRDILMKMFEMGDTFEKDLEQIYQVRNKVAHVGDFAENEIRLGVFLERLEKIDFWIDQLSDNRFRRRPDKK